VVGHILIGQGAKAHTIGDNGYLELSNLGQIQMRGKAKVWGTPTTCTIVHRHGKWYASITINCEPVSRELGTGTVSLTGVATTGGTPATRSLLNGGNLRTQLTSSIGIDLGTNTAAAISDGENGYFIENPRWYKQMLPKIKKASKDKRRKRAPNRKKIKASRRWLKASKKVSRLQRQAANQRQNWVHHQAIQLIGGSSLIASEKLETKKMTAKPKPGSKRKRQKIGLNRSILDVGWGMLTSAIKYKLEEGGGIFVEVPTKKVKPSQTCPKCGDQKEKERGQRVHFCKQCGCVQDRDLAAAEVMVLWARGILPGSGTVLANVDVSSSTVKTKMRKHCGSMQQLGQKKRSKSQLAVGDVETPTKSVSRSG